MSVIVFCGLALLGGVVTVVLRTLRPDFAVWTGVMTAIVLFGVSVSSLAEVISSLEAISSKTGFSVYTSVILKTLGIGLLSQMT
ncbi:MAG: hypothetical protein IJV98_03155, partial [Clostridia bacterium]|nr:hypothetical protein [Clostridia bacterium]